MAISKFLSMNIRSSFSN